MRTVMVTMQPIAVEVPDSVSIPSDMTEDDTELANYLDANYPGWSEFSIY